MASGRTRRPHPYHSLAWGIAGGYLIVAAVYVGLTSVLLAASHGHWSMREAMLPRINDVIVFTFFAVCGGSVGSFLNVVVWRMPQGMSVNGHSFCPRCRNTLRARDNVPVFGWLWLRGRCRDCRLPISSRYPIVEAAVAITFAFIGTLELYGWNLPYRPYPFRDPMGLPSISPQSMIPVLYHLVGLAIAWAMGLIRYDGHSMPRRLVIFAIAWLIGGMLLIPSLAIVPWQLQLPEGWIVESRHLGSFGLKDQIAKNFQDATRFIEAFVRVATALVAAGFFARVLARSFCPKADLKTDPLGSQTRRLLDLVAIIAVAAVLVGWQSISAVLLVASLLAVVATRWLGADRTDALGRFSLMMPIALALQILFWRPLMETGYWPSGPMVEGPILGGPTPKSPGSSEEVGDQTSRGVLLGFALATLLIPLWLHEKEKTAPTAAEEPDEVE